MKKKSIFVVALAALMLIAFTACEQPVPGLSKSIIDATIVQNGTFLVGQPYDASKFSVNVTYSDKSTGTLEGVNVVYVGGGEDSSAASVANGDKVQVTLPVSAPNYSGTSNVQKDVTFTGSIVAYQIDSIEVTAGPESYVYANQGQSLPSKDFTVVASYRDSSGTTQTVTMNAADYEVTASYDDTEPADTSDETKSVDATATVTLLEKFGTSISDDFALQATVAPETYEPAPVYTYEWAETAGGLRQIAYEILPETANNRYVQRGEFNADDFVAVYKVMVPTDEDGEVVTESDFTDAYEAAGYEAEDIPEYYQFEELTAAKGETLSITLTNPLEVTVDTVTTTYADRFGDDGAITLFYEYVGNEVTGELVVISNDAENNTNASAIGKITRAADGSIPYANVDLDEGGATLEIANLIEDYATAVDVELEADSTGTSAENPVTAGSDASDLSIVVTATRWKSGFPVSELADTDNDISSAVTITGTIPSVTGDEAARATVNLTVLTADTAYSDARLSKNLTQVWVENA